MLKFERYELTSEKSLTVFEFVSEGPKGRIPKIVQYSETNFKGIFNLGFGDKDSTSNQIDDTVISNNSDSRKVLATVAATVYAFTERYPNVWVYAAGNTRARTRLYRMGISNNLDEILEDFEVFGLENGAWVVFTKRDDYDAFLVRRK
ncbi:MAG: DUF6934 family protein [Pyrinomonadaceae bacterium]